MKATPPIKIIAVGIPDGDIDLEFHGGVLTTLFSPGFDPER
jgi:hypothetical protein